MKTTRKALSLLLCALMILTQLVAVSVVDIAAVDGVTGATQVITESIYLNGEKAELEAPIARLNSGSYVSIPAGIYNPVRLQLENSSGFNYTYNIYSLGLVDTDKIKAN